MELKDIVSISGKPGLNQIVGQRPNGLIVETIDAQKKRFTTSLNQKVSILEDISMFTIDGDVKLIEVLRSLDKEVKNGLELISKKNSGEEIRFFFKKILPNFDEKQVYNSDILKVAAWYAILKDIVDFSEVKETDEKDAASDKVVKKTEKSSKPKKSAPAGQKVAAKSAHVKAPKLTQRKMS